MQSAVTERDRCKMLSTIREIVKNSHFFGVAEPITTLRIRDSFETSATRRLSICIELGIESQLFEINTDFQQNENSLQNCMIICRPLPYILIL